MHAHNWMFQLLAILFEITQGVANAYRLTENVISSNPTAESYFGTSVDISESNAIIADKTGNVAFFQLNTTNGSWVLLQSFDLNFDVSVSVAIDGIFAIVGTPYKDTDGTNSGAAYTFELDTRSNLWNQTQILNAHDSGSHHFFGRSVGLHNGTAIIAAQGNECAYIFAIRASGNNNGNNNGDSINYEWIETFQLFADDRQTSNTVFGEAVALYGSLAVVTAIYSNRYVKCSLFFVQFTYFQTQKNKKNHFFVIAVLYCARSHRLIASHMYRSDIAWF